MPGLRQPSFEASIEHAVDLPHLPQPPKRSNSLKPNQSGSFLPRPRTASSEEAKVRSGRSSTQASQSSIFGQSQSEQRQPQRRRDHHSSAPPSSILNSFSRSYPGTNNVAGRGPESAQSGASSLPRSSKPKQVRNPTSHTPNAFSAPNPSVPLPSVIPRQGNTRATAQSNSSKYQATVQDIDEEDSQSTIRLDSGRSSVEDPGEDTLLRYATAIHQDDDEQAGTESYASDTTVPEITLGSHTRIIVDCDSGSEDSLEEHDDASNDRDSEAGTEGSVSHVDSSLRSDWSRDELSFSFDQQATSTPPLPKARARGQAQAKPTRAVSP